MKNKIKSVVLRHFKIYNAFPFNNKRSGDISVYNNGSLLKKCKIVSQGINNKLIIDEGGHFDHCEFVFYGNNNVIKLDKNIRAYNAQYWVEDSNNSIIIGENTVFSGKIQIAVIEGTRIEIGRDCLFSSDIVLRTGDSHSILDMERNRINPSNNVVIKDHVWVGHRVLIHKGAYVSSDSIVGAGAIVTKRIEEKNVIIAGVPAKIIKRNINWESKRF